MGLQREHKWVFGAPRAIVFFANIHRRSRHTPRGSAVQLRGPANGVAMGRVRPERGEEVDIGGHPMIGGVFGNVDGVAPGLEFKATYSF